MVVFMLFTVAVAFCIMLHQFLVYGTFFETKDVLHHEVFALGLITFTIGIFVAVKGRSKRGS